MKINLSVERVQRLLSRTPSAVPDPADSASRVRFFHLKQREDAPFIPRQTRKREGRSDFP